MTHTEFKRSPSPVLSVHILTGSSLLGLANHGLFCGRFPSHEEGTVWAGPVLLCTLIPDFIPLNFTSTMLSSFQIVPNSRVPGR